MVVVHCKKSTVKTAMVEVIMMIKLTPFHSETDHIINGDNAVLSNESQHLIIG